MRRRAKPKTVFTSGQYLTIRHPSRWPDCKVIHAYERSHYTACCMCGRCHFEPLVERTAFIRLKMAEANPAYLRRLDDSCHSLAHLWEHSLVARVEYERLIVLDVK